MRMSSLFPASLAVVFLFAGVGALSAQVDEPDPGGDPLDVSAVGTIADRQGDTLIEPRSRPWLRDDQR